MKFCSDSGNVVIILHDLLKEFFKSLVYII